MLEVVGARRGEREREKMEKEKQEMKGEGNWTAKWGGSKRGGGEKRKGERVERKIREGQRKWAQQAPMLRNMFKTFHLVAETCYSVLRLTYYIDKLVSFYFLLTYTSAALNGCVCVCVCDLY